MVIIFVYVVMCLKWEGTIFEAFLDTKFRWLILIKQKYVCVSNLVYIAKYFNVLNVLVMLYVDYL